MSERRKKWQANTVEWKCVQLTFHIQLPGKISCLLWERALTIDWSVSHSTVIQTASVRVNLMQHGFLLCELWVFITLMQYYCLFIVSFENEWACDRRRRGSRPKISLFPSLALHFVIRPARPPCLPSWQSYIILSRWQNKLRAMLTLIIVVALETLRHIDPAAILDFALSKGSGEKMTISYTSETSPSVSKELFLQNKMKTYPMNNNRRVKWSFIGLNSAFISACV